MRLSQFLDEMEVPRGNFARAIGVSRQSLQRYESGTRRPRPDKMILIHWKTGGKVSANDFFSMGEDELSKPARKRRRAA